MTSEESNAFLDQDLVTAGEDLDLPLEAVSLPPLVECHHHHGGAVAADPAGLGAELVLAFLQADGVDHSLALEVLQAGLEDRPLRAVDHDRQRGDVRLRRHQAEELRHRLLGVEQSLVHADVEDVRAALDLLACDREGGIVVAVEDQLAELRRAGDVGALADHDEVRVGTDGQWLETAETGERFRLREHPRCEPLHRPGDRGDVPVGGSAAAAGDVDPAVLGELAEDGGHGVGRLVVPAELIRQPGVRVAADRNRSDAGELVDPGTHFLRAERAVHADGQQGDVGDRIPEGLDGLPRERSAGSIGDGDRGDDREADAALVEEALDGEERRLEVERVEGRLGHQDVDAAVDQAACGFVVGLREIVEIDRAESRAVDVGRE